MYDKLLLRTFEADHINEIWRQLNEILSKKNRVGIKMNIKKRRKWKMKKTKRNRYDENCPAILWQE